jgi:excinuclease ABC subunit C
MDLKEKVKSLPSAPGVYLMKDSLGGIIYVGKSKNLKNRVGSYFQNSKSHTSKVVKLVQNIKDFEYLLTDTEFEAFMLECKLIKELKPRYNKKMKSPLSYTYIKINTSKEYASVQIVSQRSESDGCLYFGPYTSKNTVERAIQGLMEGCKILCSNPSLNCASCLYYSLGYCIGIYLGDIEKKQYDIIVNNIIGFLNGSDKSILEDMDKIMQKAAESFDFETAAKYRDYISAAAFLSSQRRIIEFTEENKNVAMLEHLNDNVVKFFLIHSSKIIFSEKYDLKIISLPELKKILSKIILQQLRISNSAPKENIGRDEIDEAQIIYSYLRSSDCKYIIISDQLLEGVHATDLNMEVENLLS